MTCTRTPKALLLIRRGVTHNPDFQRLQQAEGGLPTWAARHRAAVGLAKRLVRIPGDVRARTTFVECPDNPESLLALPSAASISTLRTMEHISYFSWDAVFSRKRYHLPHVFQKDAVYFVTMRLIDSIPEAKLQFWKYQYEQWLAGNPPPHTPEQIEQAKNLTLRRAERYLDGGHGCCVLRDPECRKPLIEAMLNRDGIEYALGDYAVVPNHAHAILKPLRPEDLSIFLGPWRSLSARKINKRAGRTGALWQPEPFDHAVRTPQSLAGFRKYIQNHINKAPPGQVTCGCGSLFDASH